MPQTVLGKELRVKIRAIAFALFMTAAFVVCAFRPASAAPALWVVQSSAGKIYLFGTVHLLREGTSWRSPELEAAIAQSQDLYLEIADPTVTASNVAALFKVGFDHDHPLSTKISKADVQLLDEAAKRYGYGSEASFEPMRPWLAFLVVSELPALHSGYTPASGVDLQLRREFVAAGKPVMGLETIDMQAHIFSDMPEATQVALLDATLRSSALQQQSVTRVDAVVNAWLSGDQDALAAALQMDKLAQGPIAAKLLTDRNETWAAALAQRLKQPGTSFVSVGAAHLVGPQGVPALLTRMGYTVTRVQIAQTAAPASAPAAATPSPTPAPSPTPIPITLTPPPGWKPRSISLSAGPFTADRMWVDPAKRGAIMAGHLDLGGMNSPDLDALDAVFHQGLAAAAGAKNTQPSTHVKICNGKQDATYTKLTLGSMLVREDVVLALSDRGYLAEYIRRMGVADDPVAIRSLLSLCAP